MKYFTEFLNEEKTKKQLLKGAHKDRGGRAKGVQTKYQSSRIVAKIPEVRFTSSDPNGSGKDWTQRVKLLNYDYEGGLAGPLAGDVEVSCDCPDFLYKGFMYIGTQNRYSIEAEKRAPKVRNPMEEGTMCKHLISALRLLAKQRVKISKDLGIKK